MSESILNSRATLPTGRVKENDLLIMVVEISDHGLGEKLSPFLLRSQAFFIWASLLVNKTILPR